MTLYRLQRRYRDNKRRPVELPTGETIIMRGNEQFETDMDMSRLCAIPGSVNPSGILEIVPEYASKNRRAREAVLAAEVERKAEMGRRTAKASATRKRNKEAKAAAEEADEAERVEIAEEGEEAEEEAEAEEDAEESEARAEEAEDDEAGNEENVMIAPKRRLRRKKTKE